jgi:hypothetical protein
MSSWQPWDWIGYTALWLTVLGRAVDEGAEKSNFLMALRQMIPYSGFWAYTPLVLLIIATTIFLFRVIRPHPYPCLKILTPLDGSGVGFKHTIIGMTDPQIKAYRS